MIDKNLFTQDLKSVYTVLQELKLIEKYVKSLIENNNLTEEKLLELNNLLEEKLLEVNNKLLEIEESFNIYEEVKDYVDDIKNYIIQNDNTTEIGGNVEIDGKLTVNSETTFNSNVEIKAPLKTTSSTEFNGTNTFNNDVNITGELYLPSSTNLIFEDGSSIVGGSKLYRHRIKIQPSTPTYTPNTYYFEIITNFQTKLTKENIAELLYNYFLPNAYHANFILSQYIDNSAYYVKTFSIDCTTGASGVVKYFVVSWLAKESNTEIKFKIDVNGVTSVENYDSSYVFTFEDTVTPM